MAYEKIKSYAKINLALNIIDKNSSLHTIETIISFIDLYDDIFVKKSKSGKHHVSFVGKFSSKIGKSNTVIKLLRILEKKKILKDKKYYIKIKKHIPHKSGLGGGSMNAASILRYFLNKKIIKITDKEIMQISQSIGSDVILGLNPFNSILNRRNKIRYFKNCKKFHLLIVKPNFGCSTKKIYSKVKTFNKPQLDKPLKKMFSLVFLKKMTNSLEQIVLSEYPKLKEMKSFLQNLSKTVFVRMTGSGSAFVAYFQSKKECENAKKQFNRKYKNYWSITSKTI